MRIHSLLHISFEDTGCIKKWAENKGHSFSETHLYAGEKLPSLNEFDLLVVMGGTMNIYEDEKYPFLTDEKRFIKSAIDSKKKVLGICLGAQLIASVLGASVLRNKYSEIGWFDVEKTDEAGNISLCSLLPDKFCTFHWHGDTFEIPDGAIHLFKSAACQNQAFLYGDRVLGLQFHPEVTDATIKKLAENCPGEISKAGEYIQTIQQILEKSQISSGNKVMSDILDYFADF